MKNHRFPWLRNRTTDNRKCEKARNIKEKCTIEMFSMVSKQLVEHHSSLNVNLEQCGCGKDEVFSSSFSKIQTSETLCFWGFSLPLTLGEMSRYVVKLFWSKS